MDYTILVNKYNKIADDYKYDLILVNSKYKDNIYVNSTTYLNYEKLKNYLLKKSIHIEIESGFRTHEYQDLLFKKCVKEKGIVHAKNFVALPYHSEHETGLAIDFCIFKNNKIYEEHDLENLTETPYIHSILKNYGFILRYPKNKESITGYKYEPWHIRYVGLSLARYLYDNGLTLDEWWNYVRNKNKEK